MSSHRDSSTGRYTCWTAERFFGSLVPYGDCRLWAGYIEKKTGYGRTEFHNKVIGAHQLAWKLAGNTLRRGRDIAHTCHMRACCNPAHLLSTTRRENIRMSMRDGRLRRGKTHHRPRRKLTNLQVLAIKRLIAAGSTTVNIAAQFGVTRSNISQIKRGYSWKDGQF